MQLFCPPCQAAFVGANRCPRCGGHLIPPEEVPVADPYTADQPAGVSPASVINRFVFGTLVGLGLYLGFRRIVTGFVLGTVSEPAGWWDTAAGLAAIFGLQSAAVFLGALLAGAARSRGFVTGMMIGGVCGGLCLAAEVLDGVPPQQLTLYVQPLLLTVLGGIAAGFGGRIWPAVPEVDTPAPTTKTLSSVRLLISDAGMKEVERPTAWVSVMVGAAVIACGVLLADQGRTAIQKGTAGLFKVESIGQGKFVSWQLATLAVLVGGMLAGSGTGAGLRHGLYAGFLASAAVVGSLISARGAPIPAPVSYTLDLMSVPVEPFAIAMLATGTSVLALGIVGGWLGGQLFLPLAPAYMRHRLRSSD